MGAALAVTLPGQLRRNRGPAWGFRFLLGAQHILPAWLLRPALMAGTWVAVWLMPEPRRHSRAYLRLVLARPPSLADVWRHFFAFVEFLMLRLRVASGGRGEVVLDPQHAEGFEALMASGRPALFGTFHFGHSDLLGFLLAERGRRVSMLRLRIGNSDELSWLEQRFAGAVSFIWVNDGGDFIFKLKFELERGASIAMQCDRSEFTAKTDVFWFLGARRVFPVTIYHLALLFDRPVVFCLGLPEAAGTRVLATPVYVPDQVRARAENLRRAHDHFQGVLAQLETLVRQHPMLWFNFEALNREASAASAAR